MKEWISTTVSGRKLRKIANLGDLRYRFSIWSRWRDAAYLLLMFPSL